MFSCHGGHVEAVGVDFWDGPLWPEANGQPLWRTRTQEEVKDRRLFLDLSLHSQTDLFQRARGPHQLVDHVDGNPHEGGEADEVSHRDAPVGILVVEQHQLWHLQEGADDDKLRRRRKVRKGPRVSHTQRWVDFYWGEDLRNLRMRLWSTPPHTHTRKWWFLSFFFFSLVNVEF